MISSLLAHERLRPFARLITAGWIGYWAMVVGLLHWPKVSSPVDVPHQDVVAHFVVYFLLAGSWVVVRRARRLDISGRWLSAWFLVFAAYAALDEITQPLTGRSCAWEDWGADMVGVGLALLLAAGLFRGGETKGRVR